MPEKQPIAMGEKHRVFSVTLNSADYPDDGFYRVIFQYWVGGNWQEEIFAFGNGDRETGATTHWTAIDQLAGKSLFEQTKILRTKITIGVHLTTPPNGRAWSTITRICRFTSKMQAALHLPT